MLENQTQNQKIVLQRLKMDKFVYGYENWKHAYSNSSQERKKDVWIRATLSSGSDIYIREYDNWIDFKSYIKSNQLKVLSIGLRYKSHEINVDTSKSDGVYVVRSIKGEFGGSSKHCYTIGHIIDNKVHKTMWITPELVEESSYIDDIENCFEEAIIIYDEAKTGTF